MFAVNDGRINVTVSQIVIGSNKATDSDLASAADVSPIKPNNNIYSMLKAKKIASRAQPPADNVNSGRIRNVPILMTIATAIRAAITAIRAETFPFA